VGNSFTFYNNGVHTHLRSMLQESEPNREPPFFLKSLTLSGGRLGEQSAGLESALQTWDWDVVILQGHSLEAHDASLVPEFLANASQLSARVRESGARPAFFMTWAYDGRPDMLPLIEKNYRLAAAQNDALLIPIGQAFERSIREIPGITLYTDDTKHPSLEGSYLAASMMYSMLYLRSPEPLAYDAGLDPAVAAQLREVAWKTALRNGLEAQ
jgi:hypothetical protein